MKIVCRNADYEKILLHAVRALPEEACGLLAGREADGIRYLEKVYLLTNVDHSSEHFSLAPEEQLAAVRDMRAIGLRPMGNWHSHPATPARPSAEDIRLAYDRNASYLILSLAHRDAPVLKAFHVEAGKATEVALEIIP